MSASADQIVAVLPSYAGRRCLYIERPTMLLADVVSVRVDRGMLHVTLAAPSDAQLICRIDRNYEFATEPSMPYGELWDVSLNLNDFYFDPDYWDGSRFDGWRLLFNEAVLSQFLARDLSWMEDWL